MTIDSFVQLAKTYGTEGLIVALLVLVVIYLAKFGGLIKNGNVARVVNVVLSVVFGGFQFGDQSSAFVSAIASVVSALVFELIDFGASKLPKG